MSNLNIQDFKGVFTMPNGVDMEVEILSDELRIGENVLGPKAIAYLLAYGIKQKLSDSGAVQQGTPTDEQQAQFEKRMQSVYDEKLTPTVSKKRGGKIDAETRVARTLLATAVLNKGLVKTAADADEFARNNPQHVDKFREQARAQLAASADIELDIELDE